ncbi:Predicted membrane protein [Porphyromonas crevioricanis]|uniref:Predicted membrane protein n=1 Tax=Porphyromonas crevioricanis TaxID=393921 RepID=A0A2X4PHM0_9PORP|nr:DUF2723 domain-containing protein [Porphyromonas crevioricanis]SQH73426.1 Predicted membrane protein [Porphyromonas crevioricanis]
MAVKLIAMKLSKHHNLLSCMEWKRYRLANNVLGWFSFFVAAVVYLLTIGPTASLWDCAEFIVCVNKLEVGHPPGAPFFMLVYNVVSHFTSDPSLVAWLCNATSALLSAFTILFLYWTTTALVRRVVAPKYLDQELTLPQAIVILGGGLVAALTYTFTDSFWFNAVEAEVYAFSSFFTAIVFWLMLKWADRADNERSDRWLILIAYLMGLSIGVHLLNLLCIPAMGLIYYYRRSSKTTAKGWLGAILLSCLIVGVMMYGVIQGVAKAAGTFDLFAVNTLGLPFNSGIYIYLVILAAALVWGVYESDRATKGYFRSEMRVKMSFLLTVLLMGIPFLGSGLWLGLILSVALGIYLFSSKNMSVKLLHMLQMSLMVIVIGYTSYGVILVRAAAKPPMNENDPSNAFAMRSYLAREQYGSNPLLYGPTFTARAYQFEYDKVYKKDVTAGKDRYIPLNKDIPEYKYRSEDKMLFPRIFDPSPSHVEGYNIWMGRNPNDMSTPTFLDNLRFFASYQVNYMYWRYFFWNFVGRQNDLQGDGSLTKGNVMTGISPIDNALIGPTDEMPDDIVANKGHNVYYLLPLLLGLLGFLYQVLKGERGNQAFWITFALFFMTGLAIVIYVNQYTGQPRERDYSYVGSFYAFCIWIGFGLAMLYELLTKIKSLPRVAAALIATVLSLVVPIQMAAQNWDDHDRSGRTATKDFGTNFLESCEPNSVIFCFGDNDTFPLWYCQEIEGIRTDVRACNLGYLGADWYVDQMKQEAYRSQPLPMNTYQSNFYSVHNIVRLNPQGSPMDIGQALDATYADNRSEYPLLPSSSLILQNDSAALNILPNELKPYFQPQMDLSLAGKSFVGRTEIALLDMLRHNRWERPLYWCISSPTETLSNLRDYLVQEGMAFRMYPATGRQSYALGNLDRSYQVFMEKFAFGGAHDPSVYFDANVRGMAETVRSNAAAPLAKALVARGDKEKAQAVLRKTLKGINPKVVPYDRVRSLSFAQALYAADMRQEGDEVISSICNSAIKSLRWFLRLSPSKLERVIKEGDVQLCFLSATECIALAQAMNSSVLNENEKEVRRLYALFTGSPYENAPQDSQQKTDQAEKATPDASPADSSAE